MTKYDIIYSELSNLVDSGELSTESAEVINRLAYEKYCNVITEKKTEYHRELNEKNYNYLKHRVSDAEKEFKEKHYENASNLFSDIINYSDSKSQRNACKYMIINKITVINFFIYLTL